MGKRVRRETPHSSALNIASMPTPRQEKVAQMLALAKECGFICQAQTEFSTQLANEISSRLMHRSAASVYQSVNFSIPLFAREAALEIFGHVAGNSEHHLNWKLTTIDACARVMDHLSKLVPSGSYLQGMSRALITDSEVTALVIAMMMPTLEATWKTMPRGGCLLKINFMYVLMDADGELHAPKNEDRQELDLGDALPRAIAKDLQTRGVDQGMETAVDKPADKPKPKAGKRNANLANFAAATAAAATTAGTASEPTLKHIPTALELAADPAELQIIRDLYGSRAQTLINTLLAFDGYFQWYYPLKDSEASARCRQLPTRHRPPGDLRASLHPQAWVLSSTRCSLQGESRYPRGWRRVGDGPVQAGAPER